MDIEIHPDTLWRPSLVYQRYVRGVRGGALFAPSKRRGKQ